jgi:hypothetical protein
MRAVFTASIALAVGLPFAAQAHHSFAEFNSQYTIELEGEIVEIRWRNPHVILELEVTEAGGETRIWKLEMESPGMLRRINVGPDILHVGDHVKVAGNPAHGGAYALYAQHFLLPSGEELLTRGRPLFSEKVVGDPANWVATEGSTAHPELGLFRVWSTTMMSQLVLAADSSASANPLTEEGQRAVAAHDPVAAGRTAGCKHKGVPRIMQQPDDMAFVKDGEDILLQIEEYDTVRRIDMTPDADRAGKPLTTLGYSTGAWEGRTLVVTTTNIAVPDYPHQLPQSEQIETVERFTPTEDGSALSYELVVTDPVYLETPLSFVKVWIALEGAVIDPYECVEE